jgi:hypothetical protein
MILSDIVWSLQALCPAQKHIVARQKHLRAAGVS